MFPALLLPAAVTLLAGAAYVAKTRQDNAQIAGEANAQIVPTRGIMTKERQAVYEVAMALVPPSEEDRKTGKVQKLEDLANVFESQGFPYHAEALRKRSKIRALPQAQKAQRRTIYKAAFASKNKQAVLHLAEAYAREGATGAAAKLKAYADGLEDYAPQQMTE